MQKYKNITKSITINRYFPIVQYKINIINIYKHFNYSLNLTSCQSEDLKYEILECNKLYNKKYNI